MLINLDINQSLITESVLILIYTPEVFSCEVISKFSQITYLSKVIISESKVLYYFRGLLLEHHYLEIFN